MDRSIIGAHNIQPAEPLNIGDTNPGCATNPVVNATRALAQGVKSMPNLLSALPVELLANIDSYLDPASQSAMSQTSRRARKLFLNHITTLDMCPVRLERAFRLFPCAYSKVHTVKITETPTLQQIEQLTARPMESVQYLDLNRCEELPDDVFLALLNCFSNLMSLNLSGSSGITGDAYMAQVHSFPNLEILNLRNCRELNGDALTPLARRFPSLLSLNLSNCPGINNQALANASVMLPRMAYLNLSSCSQLTDEGIASLSVNCPNLMALNLNGCNEITDASIAVLASNCPYLVFLTLPECEAITDQVLTVLAVNCKYLNSLSFGGVLYSKADLQSWLSNLPPSPVQQ